MKCKYCNSTWDATMHVKTCPFCGKNLYENVEYTIASVLAKLVEDCGLEILHDSGRIIAYIMDYVKGDERNKKLFRIAGNAGVFELLYEAKISDDKPQQELLIGKSLKLLEEDAFLSTENAMCILDILIEGLSLEFEQSDVNKENEKEIVQNFWTREECIMMLVSSIKARMEELYRIQQINMNLVKKMGELLIKKARLEEEIYGINGLARKFKSKYIKNLREKRDCLIEDIPSTYYDSNKSIDDYTQTGIYHILDYSTIKGTTPFPYPYDGGDVYVKAWNNEVYQVAILRRTKELCYRFKLNNNVWSAWEH